MEKIDLIKYEDDNSTFVWKYPVEEVYTGAGDITLMDSVCKAINGMG